MKQFTLWILENESRYQENAIKAARSAWDDLGEVRKSCDLCIYLWSGKIGPNEQPTDVKCTTTDKDHEPEAITDSGDDAHIVVLDLHLDQKADGLQRVKLIPGVGPARRDYGPCMVLWTHHAGNQATREFLNEHKPRSERTRFKSEALLKAMLCQFLKLVLDEPVSKLIRGPERA